jgi:hypothetical protein
MGLLSPRKPSLKVIFTLTMPPKASTNFLTSALETPLPLGPVPDFVVNARTDVLLTENGTVEQAIERGRAFLNAGTPESPSPPESPLSKSFSR